MEKEIYRASDAEKSGLAHPPQGPETEGQTTPMQTEQTNGEDVEPQKKKGTGKKVAKVITWALIIVLIVFLTLFFSSKIGQFDSIMDMLRWISSQF